MSEKTKPIDKKKAFEKKRAAIRDERTTKTLERMRELDEYREAMSNLQNAKAEEYELRDSGLDTNPKFNLARVANDAIRQERIDEINQEKAKAEAERAALQKEGDDYVSRKNQEKEQQRKEEEDMNWTYVGGDENTANQRYRTIDKTTMEEVEDTQVIENKFNDGKPTGKTDEEVYNADPSLKEKYPSLAAFKKAAQEFRDRQNTTETITTKKLVPVTTQETITQNREDFERTNHWSSKFQPTVIASMSRKLKERGANISPDELEKVFKNMSSEKDAVKWARENGYDFLVGRGGSSGSTTTRGKTDWS